MIRVAIATGGGLRVRNRPNTSGSGGGSGTGGGVVKYVHQGGVSSAAAVKRALHTLQPRPVQQQQSLLAPGVGAAAAAAAGGGRAGNYIVNYNLTNVSPAVAAAAAGGGGVKKIAFPGPGGTPVSLQVRTDDQV